jgi:hypothetical protein
MFHLVEYLNSVKCDDPEFALTMSRVTRFEENEIPIFVSLCEQLYHTE